MCTNPPMLTISVRPERHSYQMIKETGEFVVNLTTEELAFATDYCGVKSGRDTDKFQELGLTVETPEVISVPGIRQLPLTLECKVLYKQQQAPEHLLSQKPLKFYQENPVSIRDDYHTAYYGEIVSAYIIR